MKLSTLHKRRKNKLFGAKIPDGLIRRLALCNRFAASDEGRILMLYSRVLEPHRISFRDAFYDVKDRLLIRYGRPQGYALQSWESVQWRWDDDYRYTGYHQHILKIIRSGKLTLHRPTGHFHFHTGDDGYKKSVGFDELAEKCTQSIRGKKEIKNCPITTSQAKFALSWLIKLAVFKLNLPAHREPKPRVVSGDYYYDYLNSESRRVRAEENNAPVMCEWCKETFKRSEIKNIFERNFCLVCAEKSLKTPPLKRRGSLE